MFQTELPKGSLSFLLKILKGEMLTKVNNGSMSIIDVRDLAAMELAALADPNAKGEDKEELLSVDIEKHDLVSIQAATLAC